MDKRGKIVLVIIGLIIMAQQGYKITRGFRNKNPGNIKYFAGNQWHGQTGQDDDGFAIFSNAMDGIDAIGEIIDSKKRRGLITVSQIIADYAPHTENDTAAYIANVLKWTGWGANHVPVREEGDYVSLVRAIIRMENSVVPYTDAYITESLALPT